jgi:hypothetical protein
VLDKDTLSDDLLGEYGFNLNSLNLSADSNSEVPIKCQLHLHQHLTNRETGRVYLSFLRTPPRGVCVRVCVCVCVCVLCVIYMYVYVYVCVYI